MLKILAFLALTFYVFPMQTYAQSNKTHKATKGDNPVPPAPPAIVPKQDASPNLQPKPKAHVDADVRVISTPGKDGYDRAAFWVNIALAFVGFCGVVVGVCTVLFIKAQVIEMRRQRIITQKTLNAIKLQANLMKRQADAMDKQNRAMRDKERARVEIKALGMELTRVTEDFWHIKATVELSNVGMGRAYIRLGEGGLAITGEESRGLNLDVVDGFIDPNSAPITESFYFFQPDDASRGDYSQKIFDGVFVPHITGFIEYETVGARFHRDFHYAWNGSGSPFSLGAMMSSSRLVPETDEDRVSFGFWSSSWINSEENEEYDMDTDKEEEDS